MKLALLNTTIATTDGLFEVRTITLQESQQLAQSNELLSAIGHSSTAQIMSELLGVYVAENRIQFAQELNQVAHLFRHRLRLNDVTLWLLSYSYNLI